MKFCWVPVIRERKLTRERRQENQDGASQWLDGTEGKMEEMRAIPLRNPPNLRHHLSCFSAAAAAASAADIVASPCL